MSETCEHCGKRYYEWYSCDCIREEQYKKSEAKVILKDELSERDVEIVRLKRELETKTDELEELKEELKKYKKVEK